MSENPTLELLRTFFAGAGFQEVPATKTYTRDDIVRVVLGQQWAVAMILVTPEYESQYEYERRHREVNKKKPDHRVCANRAAASIQRRMSFNVHGSQGHFSRLPCAHDVVEEMEQS